MLIDRDSAQSFALVRKLVAANKLVETFDWLSCRKKCVPAWVLCTVKAKKNEQTRAQAGKEPCRVS